MDQQLRSHRWIVLGLISAALFLIIVDLTVLYTALPRLTIALSASASEKLWILNAYSLVAASLLPGVGPSVIASERGGSSSSVSRSSVPLRSSLHIRRRLRC